MHRYDPNRSALGGIYNDALNFNVAGRGHTSNLSSERAMSNDVVEKVGGRGRMLAREMPKENVCKLLRPSRQTAMEIHSSVGCGFLPGARQFVKLPKIRLLVVAIDQSAMRFDESRSISTNHKRDGTISKAKGASVLGALGVGEGSKATPHPVNLRRSERYTPRFE